MKKVLIIGGLAALAYYLYTNSKAKKEAEAEASNINGAQYLDYLKHK